MSSSFSSFADVCDKIRSTTSKNAKVTLLSEYLSTLDENSLSIAVLFLSGYPFQKLGSKQALHLGFSTIMDSLSEIADLGKDEIQQVYLHHGDMGALAEHAVSKKHVVPIAHEQLTLSTIYDQFKKITDASGSGSGEARRKILTGLLINCSPLEAKYIIKVVTSEMRIGLVQGLVELAVAKAFCREIKDLREAMLLSGDIVQVSILAKKGALNSVILKPLLPLSFMLADAMFTAEEIINYYQKPLICEYKYDGIRVQLHKFGDNVRMFSRKLEDITRAFPELSEGAILSKANFILDGEILASRNGKPLPFQELQKRIHRKTVTDKIIAEVPVIYIAYDLLYLDGEQVIKKSLSERKRLLSSISLPTGVITISCFTSVDSVDKVLSAFKTSREMGHEGLLIKDPESQYHPGKRGKYWVKLKQELDTVDAVVVMAEYGHGKRAGTLSDYTFAVWDTHERKLRTIGKAYSGLTDGEIGEMTSKLRSITIEDQGFRLIVRPEIVLEIAFDSIQKSDRHESGFALRFPRIKNIRSDKAVNDIDTLDKIKTIHDKQALRLTKNPTNS